MACYDCKDCKLNYQKGGKCNRWEYDCPFNHLRSTSNDAEEQAKINHDLLIATKIKDKLLEIKDLQDKLHFIWNYERELSHADSALSGLEHKLNHDLLKEWVKIIK